MLVRFRRGVGLGPDRAAARPGDVLDLPDPIASGFIADGRAEEITQAAAEALPVPTPPEAIEVREPAVRKRGKR